MINLEEAIGASKSIMQHGLSYKFQKYDAVFFMTTEYLRIYLNNIAFNKDNALTILAGGDHVFNLIYKGVREIDAFDINVLTYFTYQIRAAMMRAFSFNDFISANLRFASSPEVALQILKKLKGYLSDDVYRYYLELIEYAINNKQAKFKLLFRNFFDKDVCKAENLYLDSKSDYDRVRNNLDNVKVSFKFGDGKEIFNNLDKLYDIILLSNIADFFGNEGTDVSLEDLNRFLVGYYNYLKENGVVVGYTFRMTEDYFLRSNILRKDFDGETYKINGEGYYLKRKKG